MKRITNHLDVKNIISSYYGRAVYFSLAHSYYGNVNLKNIHEIEETRTFILTDLANSIYEKHYDALMKRNPNFKLLS